MTAADQIRALADTGTPAGQWSAHEGDLEGGTLVDYVTTLFKNREDGTSTGRLFLTLAPNAIDPEKGDHIVPAMTGDGPNAEANAVKIVAAVNALPKVADYDEAVMAYLNHQTVCGVGSSCPELVALWQALVVARGVLVAALGVTA